MFSNTNAVNNQDIPASSRRLIVIRLTRIEYLLFLRLVNPEFLVFVFFIDLSA
jgi:hypothetical protein